TSGQRDQRRLRGRRRAAGTGTGIGTDVTCGVDRLPDRAVLVPPEVAVRRVLRVPGLGHGSSSTPASIVAIRRCIRSARKGDIRGRRGSVGRAGRPTLRAMARWKLADKVIL